MDSIQRKKKQTYLLLELLIAFFLLSLFLAPMLGSPFAYVRKQIQAVTSIQLGLEGEKFLALIEERLRTGEISWDQIVASQKEPVLLESCLLQIQDKKKTISYETKLFLHKAHLETQEESSFGTVKAFVKIYKKNKKETKVYQTQSTLFVLKKEVLKPGKLTEKS